MYVCDTPDHHTGLVVVLQIDNVIPISFLTLHKITKYSKF